MSKPTLNVHFVRRPCVGALLDFGGTGPNDATAPRTMQAPVRIHAPPEYKDRIPRCRGHIKGQRKAEITLKNSRKTVRYQKVRKL
jgi:hypothetical protein